MYYLTIDFKQAETKAANGETIKYYPNETHKETNNEVVAKIESLRIKSFDTFLEETTDLILSDLI